MPENFNRSEAEFPCRGHDPKADAARRTRDQGKSKPGSQTQLSCVQSQAQWSKPT